MADIIRCTLGRCCATGNRGPALRNTLSISGFGVLVGDDVLSELSHCSPRGVVNGKSARGT